MRYMNDTYSDVISNIQNVASEKCALSTPPRSGGIRYVVCDVIRFVSNIQKYRVKDLSALGIIKSSYLHLACIQRYARPARAFVRNLLRQEGRVMVTSCCGRFYSTYLVSYM
jgi:hypothetical protein